MIERLRSTLDACFEFRDGRTWHLKTDKVNQKAVTIFTAGNPERETFGSISRVFNRITKNMGTKLIGEFCFPASSILASEPDRVASQLEAVKKAGKQFAEDGIISDATIDAANKDYIDDPVEIVNNMTKMILKMREERSATLSDTIQL